MILEDAVSADTASCYEPFDHTYCHDLMRRVIAPIADHYFRPRIIGAEKIPARGPLILAANHSGTAFPYDAIVLDFALWQREGMTEIGRAHV